MRRAKDTHHSYNVQKRPFRGVLELQSNFIEIALRHGCSPVNLLHIFRTLSTKNTAGRLLLEFVLKNWSGVLILRDPTVQGVIPPFFLMPPFFSCEVKFYEMIYTINVYKTVCGISWCFFDHVLLIILLWGTIFGTVKSPKI